jgi:hypothetical protein
LIDKKNKEEHMKKSKLSVLIIVLFVSLLTLWLVNSPLKFILYFFEVTLILLLFYSLSGKTRKIKMKNKGNALIKLDYAFLLVSAVLLVFTALKIDSILTLVCSIIVSFFLPGHVLLRLLNFHFLESWIKRLVLSFALSIGLTSMIFTVTLPFIMNRAILLSAVYFGVSLCPLLRDRIYKSGKDSPVRLESHVKEYDLADVLLLLWITLFFVFVILSLYPKMSLVPGLDIVNHFSSSKLLVLAPEAYSSIYPWFHTTWANVYELSTPAIEVFQTGLAFLSIMVIFSFYVMAKAYLKDVDRRAPVLATVFFSVFAGLGWLYFLPERIITTTPSTYYGFLGDAFNKSYFDVGYAQGWIWFWFRPLTLGLTLLFILLYLMQEQRLSKGTFMLTFTLILLSLNFVHFSESVVFVLFLLVLCLLKPMKQLRLWEAASASFLAMLGSLFLLFAYQHIVGASEIGPPTSHVILLTAASVLSIVFAVLKKRPTVRSWYIIKFKWLAIGVGLIYIWLLIIWLFTAETFEVAYVATAYSVPWQFYPMLFGLSGLFAIFASLIIAKSYSKHTIIVFILLLLFGVLFGRALTYYNLNVSYVSYWERRIVPIAYAASAVLAPIALIELFKRLKKYKIYISYTLLSFLVILAISSTFLSLELQTYNDSQQALSDGNLKLVNLLNKLSPDSVLLTATDYSASLALFAPSSWAIDLYRYQLWSAKYPELPLNVLYSMDNPVTTFLREADIQEINKNYASSYLFNHLVFYSSPSNSANSTEIIPLPNMVAPSSNSQTVLVLPDYQDTAIWYAYDILSQARLNYTTALIEDVNTISKAKILIAATESVAQQLISYKEIFPLNFENLIILNPDGYTDLYLKSSPKMSLSLDSTSQEIATLNAGGSIVENLTTTGAPSFEMSSTYTSGHFYSLLEDDLEGWTSSGIGVGNISSPQLTLNSSVRVSGDSSTQIDVESGTFGYWQVSKNYTSTINANNFDFISFYWYGRNDGKNYVLQYHSDPVSNYWYYFKDSWIGWKKVLIPMRIPDGSYNLNDVSFTKFTNGEPTWNNICKIEIRNEGSNLNLAGKFLIDKFGFESAETINATITTSPSFYGFKLFNYNGANWVNIAELTSPESISIPNYTLMSGINSTMIFGDSSFLELNSIRKSGYSISTISVKLPPYVNDTSSSSVQLKIIPIVSDFEVDEIVGPNSSLHLNTKINVASLETPNTVIAWYKNNETLIPFAIEDNENDFKIIYVNIYPLTTNLISDKSNYELLGQVAQILNLNQIISEAQITAENPVRGNLAAFSKIDFEGSVTIHSPTAVIKKMSGALTLTLSNVTLTDLSKIVFIGDRIILDTKNGSLTNGMGFYSNIYSDNLGVTSATEKPATITLEFNDGTKQTIVTSTKNIHIDGDSVAILRQPKLDIDGKITFYNLYTYAQLSDLRIFGSNATLKGRLSFDVNFGDEFTITTNFTYTGKIIADEYQYNELDVLCHSIPVILVSGIFVITVYALVMLIMKRFKPMVW